MAKKKADLNKVATDWAMITIQRFKRQIDKRKIGQTGKLFNSFVSNIIKNSDGTPWKIELSFLFYGRFVDMGVGKGVKVGRIQEEKTLRGRAAIFKQPRKAKPWYSKTKAAETRALAEVMAREFKVKGINVFEDGFLDDTDSIKIKL
jgi:hypothetical protein